MDKYINASEVEMIIESEAENLYGEGLDVSAHRMWKLQNKIRDMPSADVRENIHGEWIEEEYSKEDDWGVNNYHFHICSECHEKISNEYFSKRWVCCPYCGAVMKGEIE